VLAQQQQPNLKKGDAQVNQVLASQAVQASAVLYRFSFAASEANAALRLSAVEAGSARLVAYAGDSIISESSVNVLPGEPLTLNPDAVHWDGSDRVLLKAPASVQVEVILPGSEPVVLSPTRTNPVVEVVSRARLDQDTQAWSEFRLQELSSPGDKTRARSASGSSLFVATAPGKGAK
jgi:hypothetical protein